MRGCCASCCRICRHSAGAEWSPLDRAPLSNWYAVALTLVMSWRTRRAYQQRRWRKPWQRMNAIRQGVFTGGLGQGQPSAFAVDQGYALRSEEHTSELQSLMRISYAVFCLKKKNKPESLQILSAQ